MRSIVVTPSGCFRDSRSERSTLPFGSKKFVLDLYLISARRRLPGGFRGPLADHHCSTGFTAIVTSAVVDSAPSLATARST